MAQVDALDVSPHQATTTAPTTTAATTTTSPLTTSATTEIEKQAITDFFQLCSAPVPFQLNASEAVSISVSLSLYVYLSFSCGQCYFVYMRALYLSRSQQHNRRNRTTQTFGKFLAFSNGPLPRKK